MKKLFLLLPAIGVVSFTSAMSQTPPQISIKVLNCLTDGSGTPGVCALSNIKKVRVGVTLDPKGNALKSVSETETNPTGTLPENYIVVRVVENQNGTAMPIRIQKDGTLRQMIYVNLEILEDAIVRQNKIQDFVNQGKAEDAANGVDQAVINEATQKNAEIISALDGIYIENRIGRFKISVEYHSTQSGVWNGTVTSPEVIVDVVNKGSGFTALENP